MPPSSLESIYSESWVCFNANKSYLLPVFCMKILKIRETEWNNILCNHIDTNTTLHFSIKHLFTEYTFIHVAYIHYNKERLYSRRSASFYTYQLSYTQHDSLLTHISLGEISKFFANVMLFFLIEKNIYWFFSLISFTHDFFYIRIQLMISYHWFRTWLTPKRL